MHSPTPLARLGRARSALLASAAALLYVGPNASLFDADARPDAG
ncbi:hypothetical protein QCN29_29125 [Streptomyces sp. HNM0663]|uniref:Uncharacterized protein n=1 Tax=Streptomyces chengmaiensis TaxID=3040919 RepID=A0ABT6HVN2_9ACTN|nr:hypothetical protein [Streptomyces chengmaiensis]MDH2392771.1 hypothetical protein [Streptomyces chengmaiensis]